MNGIKKIVNKVKEHLKDDGLKDTLYISYHYVLRQISVQMEKKSDYTEYKVKENEKKFLTEKKQPVVYIVAAVPYYDIGGGQRCSQLAKTFNKMGYRVRYLYSNYSCDKKDSKVAIPLEAHMNVNDKALSYVKEHVKQDDLFIFEAPLVQFEGLIDIASAAKCRIIYENIDNWETSLGKDFFHEDVLKKILSAAEVLVGTAKPLVKQLEDYLDRFGLNKEEKQILYLPNAVDEEMFCGAQKCQQPEDLVIGEKTFLYYGSLWGEWFDWDLIIGLAKRHPEYAVNLIGNAASIQKRVQECPSNVHFLGLKAQLELPAYLQYVDYALLPFKRGEIGDYVSPLKIFEYISMYTKVLSTSLPDIENYPNVYFGDVVEEWEKAMEAEPMVDQDAADRFIEKNTWFSRVSMMIQSVYADADQSRLDGKLAIIILNYNNKNVIFKCVNSLLAYKDRYHYEIIVVDNGSTDGSYELLKEKYAPEDVAVYRNTKNGCSSGRNLGVSKTKMEYIMFLDSDQWVTNPYWLKPYEDIMEAHEDFGSIGWAAGFFNSSGGACYTVDAFTHRYMPPQMLCRTDIGYLGSGGMLMRTADFHSIQGFDVYYDPTCYEDTDISLKMRDFGKEIYYCPYLGVIHLPHQTTNAGSAEHKKLIKDKKNYFIEKWEKKNPNLLKYTK